MARRVRTPEEYEREIANIIERFVDEGREFAALDDPDDWQEFVKRKILGYHYDLDISPEAAEFFEAVRTSTQDALVGGGFKEEFFESPGGEQRSRFRDVKTGRFVSFQNIKDFVFGRFGNL